MEITGRKLLLTFGPLALVGAGVVIFTFHKYGQGNFTRAARIVEARGRAYELAAGIARCMNASGRAELPETTAQVPAEPPHKLSFDAEASDRAFSADAFRCAGFAPRGQIHVQVAWNRTNAASGVGRAFLDENDDGRVDFSAESVVECAPSGEERCKARMVEEFWLPK